MNNREYLEGYLAWKDMVNTEDIDTPERYDAYLKNIENEARLDAITERLRERLDALDPVDYPGSVDTRDELLDLAELVGIDITWWEAKPLTSGERNSFEVTDAVESN